MSDDNTLNAAAARNPGVNARTVKKFLRAANAVAATSAAARRPVSAFSEPRRAVSVTIAQTKPR